MAQTTVPDWICLECRAPVSAARVEYALRQDAEPTCPRCGSVDIDETAETKARWDAQVDCHLTGRLYSEMFPEED